MAADAVGRAFAALADPTRRAVVERLRGGDRRAGELASLLSISPPALSRHLRVLQQGKLIEQVGDDSDARVRVFRLRREVFAQLRTWVDGVEAMWSEQLAAFAEHVQRTKGKRS
jgi:DNA-binding transcriptional ArsR family regulator